MDKRVFLNWSEKFWNPDEMGREIRIKPRQLKLFRIFNFNVSVSHQNVRIVVITNFMNQTITFWSHSWVVSAKLDIRPNVDTKMSLSDDNYYK